MRACGSARTGDRRLAVRIAVSESTKDEPESRVETVGTLRITAAPVEMWREVPRDLLPVARAMSGALSVPRSPGAWRVQAIGEERASSWVDVPTEANSVELTLLASEVLSYRITADGAPLAGARFYLVRTGDGSVRNWLAELLGFASADGEGRIDLTLPAGERASVVVSSVTRSGAAFLRLDGIPPAIELGPGFTVRGRLVNEAGEPVRARLIGSSQVPDGFGVSQRHQGRSGPDGLFALSGFSRGPATVRGQDGLLEFARSLTLDRSLDLGSVVLMAPELVWIRVVDMESGAPVPGARVTNASGELRVAGEAGLVVVSTLLGRRIGVTGDRYVPERFDLPEGVGAAAEEPFVLPLSPAFRVEGVFVAADGQTPAVDGRLTVRNDAAGVTDFGSVGADGSFAIDLGPGAWELELMAGNAGLRRLEVQGRPGELRKLGVIVAPASAWISGYVMSDAYVPVARASVSYLRPSEYGPIISLRFGNIAKVSTDDEGYFELYGLELGASNLRVEADGFAPLRFTVEAEAVGWVDAGTLELSRGRQVTVRSDVDRGRVVLDPGLKGMPQEFIEGMLTGGEAVIEAVPNRPFSVVVHEQGDPVCEKDMEEGKGDVVVRCDGYAMRVHGRVTMGGRPAEGALWWSEERRVSGGPGSPGTGPAEEQSLARAPRSFELSLDSEGRYRRAGVLPGRWEVFWVSPTGGFGEARKVTVPKGPGDEVTIDFDYGGVSIEGVVLDSEWRPAPRATVDIYPDRQTALTDREGKFAVGQLEPGAYQVRARFRDQRSPFVDVVLRDYSDRETVQLVLEEDPQDPELTILVRGGGDGFCFVETGSTMSRMARIDSGHATMTFQPPLADRVRIACQADGRWILTAWQDLERALDRGVEFDPFESDSSIVLEGEPSSAAVQITGPGGWDLGKLRLWFGGASAFAVGETIFNLPVGEYALRWGNQVRTVWTERRRGTEVEIED